MSGSAADAGRSMEERPTAGHSGGAHLGVGHPSGAHPGAGQRWRPGSGPAAQAFEERTGVKPPRIVAWEITRSCNLACAHCRASAHPEPYPGELSLGECRALIDQIAALTDPILILTGGEPLMRVDIWDIIEYAHEAGLHPVIGTNGTLVTDAVAERIAAHGIDRVSISLDFPTAEAQDAFRGMPGAFDDALAGMRNLRAHGVGVQVNTTVTKMNSALLNEIHGLACDEGAAAFHPFLLVPCGRGEDLVDVELSPDEYEEVLTWVYRCQKESPMQLKPTDAPQYYRILRQQAAREGAKVTPATHGMQALTRGCLGGISFVFISHVGDVQPCGYFDMKVGNVRERSFEDIWLGSPVLQDLRDFGRLKGKCGACEYKGVCGGCRARALAATGDYLAEEPYCAYVPAALRRKRVLDAVQGGFPLAHDPYGVLSGRLGMERSDVLRALEELRRDGSIRCIGASLSARHLGYRSSLCALAVPGAQDAVDRAAALVSAHYEVTHNYLRNDRYNVWFTVITADDAARKRLLREICNETGVSDVLDLPASTIYKIRVDFAQMERATSDSAKGNAAAGEASDAAAGAAASEAAGAAGAGVAAAKGTTEAQPDSSIGDGAPFDPTNPFDVALVRWLQEDVTGVEPFEDAAAFVSSQTGAHADEKDVLSRLHAWQADGTMRRFGAMVRHRRIGYAFNAMAVWDAADADMDATGTLFAGLAYVSHCYCRPRCETWPYDLYTVVHARTEAELGERLAHMASLCGIEPKVLVSLKEYKKSTPVYYPEA